MSKSDLKGKSIKELQDQSLKLKEEIFKSRINSTFEGPNYLKNRNSLKKQIARINTILTQEIKHD